jgi:hypothetical protein
MVWHQHMLERVLMMLDPKEVYLNLDTCFEMRTLSRMFHGDNIFMMFYDILR